MGHKAVLHIFSTYNNVLITATDLTGAETLAKVSGGMVTKKGSDAGGQFAATRAAEMIAEMLAEKEFDQVIVKYRGAGGNRSHRSRDFGKGFWWAGYQEGERCRWSVCSNKGC